MSNPAVTADDLYGDLGSVSAVPVPVPPPPEAQPASKALEDENAALRARVAALETEARVWAAQRAVLVANLGALLKTAKAVDARRVREIHALREQVAGAVRGPQLESRQSAPELRRRQAAGSGGGGEGVDNRPSDARGEGLWRGRERSEEDRRRRDEPRSGMRREELFHWDGARRRSSRDEERVFADGDNKGGDMGRTESRFRGRREDEMEFFGSDDVERRNPDERRRRGDPREGYM